MKMIYITESQKGMIGNFINENIANDIVLLNEENRTQKKKCVEIIKTYINPHIKGYLDIPLLDLPYDFQNMLNPDGALFKSVANNQNGCNKFIDYLRLNLYSQFGIGRDNSLVHYIPGIARIACKDCKYYEFTLDVDGGKIIEFARLLKLIDKKPEFMLSNITLDADLNGLSYNEFEAIFKPKLKEYIANTKSSLKSDDYKVIHASEYDIIPIPDRISGGYGGSVLLPTEDGRKILDKFGKYTDWCVCNNRFANEEFSQYLSNGGKMYICAKRGFENIQRPETTETPLDEYGLSLINVIVGTDGLPTNVTTRYNHDFGGENHSEMWEATHLQKILQVDFLKTFKPRKKEELRSLHLAESKVPSAQDQVKGRVNAGIMDAVCAGMCEETNETHLENSKYDDLGTRGDAIWKEEYDSTPNIDQYLYGEDNIKEMLQENQNDKLANDYIKNTIGIQDFNEIRKLALQVCHAVPSVRANKNFYLLGVIRLIYEEKVIGSKLKDLNYIIHYINNNNIKYDRNLNGLSFDELYSLYANDILRKEQKTVEKVRQAANGYVIKYLETFEDANDMYYQDWCITQEEDYFQDCVNSKESVYLVENPELMKYNYFKDKKWEEVSWKMTEPYDADLGTFGSGKAPYDNYGLSRFVVLVNQLDFLVYSRWNLTDGFDGEFLTEEQLEELLGAPFDKLFPYVPSRGYEEDNDNLALQFMGEGAEPESDEYTIGGEGGNNEYFHVVNESVNEKFKYDSEVNKIANFMKKEGLNVYPFPKVNFNWDEQDGLFIKTGYYTPSDKEITLFCKNRHPKDILRSYAHEMIHHMQNLNGDNLNFTSEDDVKDNEKLEKLESEAYLKGNIYFRKWTEYEKENKQNLNESPDRIEVANIDFDDECARPFLVFKGFPKEPIIGIEGQTHGDLIGEFLDTYNEWGISDELKSAIENKEIRPILSNAYELWGRYFGPIKDLPWAGNIISVYDYNPKNLKSVGTKLIPVINKMKEWGVSVNLSNLDFDDWAGNKCFRYPISWLLNGLAEIYTEAAYTLQRDKSENRSYTFIGKNGISFKLDEKGRILEKALPILREEIVDESLSPNEVDLSSFNIKKNLNPKFWKNDRLDSRIRMKLLDIADDFIEFLGVDWVKPEDITITGSLANYNWDKKYSDIDLHIIMDYSKVDKRTDFVDNYFYSQKKLWNEEHKDLKIYGFQVEVFVQDTKKQHTSSGVYSLEKDKWVTEPERDKLAKKKVNKNKIKNTVSKYTKKIDDLINESKSIKGDDYKARKLYEKAEALFDEIKKLRKEDLTVANNEINEGNIIFKCLRRLGYIEKLDKLINKGYNILNSLP